LRAGGTDRPCGRCSRETAGCSTAKDATAGNSTICHDKFLSLRKIGTEADCNLKDIRASVRGQDL